MTQAPQFDVIELDEPIQRGDTQITQVTIRRPNAGEMRGLSMVNVVQMQVDALLTLIPRICEPVLMAQELKAMNPADFMQIGTVIAQYYVPKKMQGGLGMTTLS